MCFQPLIWLQLSTNNDVFKIFTKLTLINYVNFCFAGMPSTSKGINHYPLSPANTEGWIGHPLDPIGCLFDTLAEVSILRDDNSIVQTGKHDILVVVCANPGCQ
jgi:hypothetical protein